MNFVSATFKLGQNVFGQKFGVTSGDVNIEIIFAKKSVQHGFKRAELLHFIKQNIVGVPVGNLRVTPVQEFGGIDFPSGASKKRVFSDFPQIVGGVDSECDDVLGGNAFREEVCIEQCVEQIGFSASANSGDYLDEAVLLPGDEPVRLYVASDLHIKLSV